MVWFNSSCISFLAVYVTISLGLIYCLFVHSYLTLCLVVLVCACLFDWVLLVVLIVDLLFGFTAWWCFWLLVICLDAFVILVLFCC